MTLNRFQVSKTAANNPLLNLSQSQFCLFLTQDCYKHVLTQSHSCWDDWLTAEYLWEGTLKSLLKYLSCTHRVKVRLLFWRSSRSQPAAGVTPYSVTHQILWHVVVQCYMLHSANMCITCIQEHQQLVYWKFSELQSRNTKEQMSQDSASEHKRAVTKHVVKALHAAQWNLCGFSMTHKNSTSDFFFFF